MNKRIVAAIEGTLPSGEWVDNVPIWGVDCASFQFSDDIDPCCRQDINLGHILAFTINNVLTHDECNCMISLCEELGFRLEAPGISTAPGMRMNKTVHWVSTDNILLPKIFSRLNSLLPQEIDGKKLHMAFSQRINVYKYDKGDVFNIHTDGDWPMIFVDADGEMVESRHYKSKLTMLLYLNDKVVDGICGGNTRLFVSDSIQSDYIDVEPVKGSALFFRHGRGKDSVYHMGTMVYGDQPKYVARINVMYDN